MHDKTPQAPVDWPRFYRFALLCGLVVLFLLFFILVYYPILVPLLISAFFAYILASTVDRLEMMGVSRPLAVLGIILISVSIIVLLITRIVPLLYGQMLFLVQLTPQVVDVLTENWFPLIQQTLVTWKLMTAEEFEAYITSANVIDELRAQLQAGIGSLWNTGTSVVGGVFNILLIPVITFFMLNELRSISSGLRRLVPVDLIAPTMLAMQRINSTLRSVIKGQAMVAGILAVLYVIGLSIVGLPSAIAIGVVAGMARMIPYFDIIVGAFLSTIVLISGDLGWGAVLGVVIVFLVVQSVDGMFITPRVIGERVGLHPAVVILSVVAFGVWFGFWGVLLAIPVIAIIKTLLLTSLPYYMQSRFYAPSWYAARPPPVSETTAEQNVSVEP